jgi:hypothetical protein
MLSRKISAQSDCTPNLGPHLPRHGRTGRFNEDMHVLLIAVSLLIGAAWAAADAAQDCAASAAGPPAPVVYPQPVGAPAIPAPMAIRHLLGRDDVVVVRVRIGTDGRVLDFVPLDLPHRDLLRRVDELVPQLQFHPGTDGGVPFVSDVDVKIPVSRTTDLGVVSETIANHVESQRLMMDPDAFRLALTPAGELDEPLRLVDRGRQVVAVDEDQQPLKGESEVEFYVDPQGVPRLPRAYGDAPAVVREAAVQTVGNFRFAPPMHNGYPTVVKGRITIRQGG